MEISKPNVCQPEEMFIIFRNPVQRFYNQVIFPVQCFVVIFGNMLTLAVLLSGAPNRANRLLACLAFCDCCVFLFFIPNTLGSFAHFNGDEHFYRWYYSTIHIVNHTTNWFLAASIWFVLVISVERLLIIKFPFRSLKSNQTSQITIIGIIILCATFMLTGAHYFGHYCKFFRLCNGTQLLALCKAPHHINATHSPVDPVHPFIREFQPMWVTLNSFLAVLIPIVIVIAINISLLRLVKLSNKQELVRSASSAHRPRRSDEQEKSMTRAIVAIVTCFSLTQGPSALIFIANELGLRYHLSFIYSTWFVNLWVLCNGLVLTGKMLNVILFCLTSASFRHRLVCTVTRWCSKLRPCNRPPLNRQHVYATSERVTLRSINEDSIKYGRLLRLARAAASCRRQRCGVPSDDAAPPPSCAPHPLPPRRPLLRGGEPHSACTTANSSLSSKASSTAPFPHTLDASRSLLTQKSSIASFSMRGRSINGDPYSSRRKDTQETRLVE